MDIYHVWWMSVFVKTLYTFHNLIKTSNGKSLLNIEDMARAINNKMINPEKWNKNFEVHKGHVVETSHFPNNHTKLKKWYHYQRKRINEGTMLEEQKRLFESLAESKYNAHTGEEVNKLKYSEVEIIPKEV